MKSRNGKIARLPAEIRQELNQRLERSEPSTQLLPWLNALPEVQQVLREEFEGVPINKQNLSQWRRGGFQESQALRFIQRQTADSLSALLVRGLAALTLQSKRPAKPAASPRNTEKHPNHSRKDSYGKDARPASPGESA
jgi:hypothetical protein